MIFFYHTSSEFANLHMKSEKVLQKCDIFLSHPTQKTTVKISHFFEFLLKNLTYGTILYLYRPVVVYIRDVTYVDLHFTEKKIY